MSGRRSDSAAGDGRSAPGGRYLRIESAEPDAAGCRVGMFGLLRDLRHSGRLGPADTELAAGLVARAYALHAEPPAAAYAAGGVSWFVADLPADGIPALCDAVAALLERHGVLTRTIRTDDPGVVSYADAVQVVARSRTAR